MFAITQKTKRQGENKSQSGPKHKRNMVIHVGLTGSPFFFVSISLQALCLADRCGRRCLLISGAIGMFLSCVIMALVGLNKVEGAEIR